MIPVVRALLRPRGSRGGLRSLRAFLGGKLEHAPEDVHAIRRDSSSTDAG
jgi:hypothetical protein